MIDPNHALPLMRQAELLKISRSNVYYLPQPVCDADLALMRRIDELHLKFPFAGSRMLRDLLRLEGFTVGLRPIFFASDKEDTGAVGIRLSRLVAARGRAKKIKRPFSPSRTVSPEQFSDAGRRTGLEVVGGCSGAIPIGYGSMCP